MTRGWSLFAFFIAADRIGSRARGRGRVRGFATQGFHGEHRGKACARSASGTKTSRSTIVRSSASSTARTTTISLSPNTVWLTIRCALGVAVRLADACLYRRLARHPRPARRFIRAACGRAARLVAHGLGRRRDRGRLHRVSPSRCCCSTPRLASTGTFFVLHELWSGMLLALAFGLHRPGQGNGGRCRSSVAAAALAVAIREHALALHPA